MSREAVTQKVGDLEVIVTQLPARRAFRLSWRLGSLVPHVLARIDPKSLRDDADVGRLLMPALIELFGRLSVDEADALSREILQCASAIVTDAAGQKRKVDLTNQERIDEVFTGRIAEMYGAIGFALSVNFRDFIGGALASLSDAPSEAGAA